MDTQITRGVIIGKFLPPHTGHSYLIDFAASFVDELWVFICSLPSEEIPGTVRYEWLCDMFPRIHVHHIHEVNPLANRKQAGATSIWANAILQRMLVVPDYVFASEAYGWDFARALGAQFIPVDPARDQFPVSGSELREKPFRYWHFLPKIVRPWFVRTIRLKHNKSNSLYETTRNSTDLLRVIAELARLMNTLYVPPYAEFFESFAARETLSPDSIKRAELAQYRALKVQARWFIFVMDSSSMCWDDLADLSVYVDDSPELDLAPHFIQNFLMDYYHQLI